MLNIQHAVTSLKASLIKLLSLNNTNRLVNLFKYLSGLTTKVLFFFYEDHFTIQYKTMDFKTKNILKVQNMYKD